MVIVLSDSIQCSEVTSESLNELARKNWYVSPAKSVEYGYQALELAKKASNDRQVVIALRYIGVGYMNMGNYDKALEYFTESNTLAKSINDIEGISASLNNIALVYDSMGMKQKSLEYYLESLKIDEQRKDYEGIAISLNNIGLVYMDLNKFEQAESYFIKSLKISQDIEFKENMSMVLGNIGDLYAKQCRFDEAIGYMTWGLELSKELGNKRGIAEKLAVISEIYKNKGEYPIALQYLKESLDIALEARLKETVMKIYRVYSDIYSETGDIKQAFDYYRRYTELRDELLNEELAQKVEKIETKYEIEKREKEKEILKLELNKLKILRNSLIAGVGFILVITYIIYKLYRIKKRAHMNIVTLSKIGQEITASLNLEQIFNTFFENIKELMNVDCFGIGIYDEHHHTLEFKYFIRDSIRLPSFFSDLEKADNWASWCLSHKKEVFINDMDKEYRKYLPTLSRNLADRYPQSVFYVPLIANDRVLGMFTVQCYKKNAYSKNHLNILKTLSSYLAIALDNSKAYLQIDSQKKQIERNMEIIRAEKDKSEKLLLNILPVKVAEELKIRGKIEPEMFNDVTVFFSDFVGFTKMSACMEPKQLIDELNELYTEFDNIMEKNHCERIKTIGDAYLALCGLPVPDPNHAKNIVKAAIEIMRYMTNRNKTHQPTWQLRIGIHTGKVVAGVIGIKKYIYDVFGDTINTASRMETNCEPMNINISENTYQIVKDEFVFIKRKPQEIKGKGEMNMYYVDYS